MQIGGGSATGRAETGPGPAGVILAVLVLIAGVITGYAGQSIVTIGAPAHVSLSASVIGSSGGIGRSQPVRVRLLIGVANTGEAPVRVAGAWTDTVMTAFRGLTPATVDVPAGQTAEFSADAAVFCSWPAALTLPDLRIEEPNGEEQPLPLAGASVLTEACTRGGVLTRPLLVLTMSTQPAAAGDPLAATCRVNGRTPCDQLVLDLDAPSKRPADIRAVRAGGVVLPFSQDQAGGRAGTGNPSRPTAHISGGDVELPIVLTAPATCPAPWLTAGLPSSIQVDLQDGTSPVLEVGPALAAWLLRTACRPGGNPPGAQS